MTITKCGMCGVHAVGRVERYVLFGHLKTHMSTVCKGCREIEKGNRRTSKEHEFRDRIQSVPRPRKVNAAKLMEAFAASEEHKRRLILHDFIGL